MLYAERRAQPAREERANSIALECRSGIEEESSRSEYLSHITSHLPSRLGTQGALRPVRKGANFDFQQTGNSHYSDS